jgi:hypothetical protein
MKTSLYQLEKILDNETKSIEKQLIHKDTEKYYQRN